MVTTGLWPPAQHVAGRRSRLHNTWKPFHNNVAIHCIWDLRVERNKLYRAGSLCLPTFCSADATETRRAKVAFEVCL